VSRLGSDPRSQAHKIVIPEASFLQTFDLARKFSYPEFISRSQVQEMDSGFQEMGIPVTI